MPVQLTPEAEARIQQKVQCGLYANAEAAIDVAVQLLDEHDRRLTRLRAAIAEGEVGQAVPWTPDLMQEILTPCVAAEKRLTQMSAPKTLTPAPLPAHWERGAWWMDEDPPRNGRAGHGSPSPHRRGRGGQGVRAVRGQG